MDQGNNWRNSGSPRGWNPRFRGQYYESPRFQGGRGWQQRSFQHQQNSPFCSTPINHHPYRPNRPNFFGRGRFSSPKLFNNNEEQGIDAWVSPDMWDDPWKEFTHSRMDGADDINNVESERRWISTTQFVNDWSSTSEHVTTSASASMLEVSDMIMRSAMESTYATDESAEDLPDIELKRSTTVAPSIKTDETEENLESESAKNVLSMIKL